MTAGIGDVDELDHTADAGIRIRSPSFADLCATAARAMFALILPRGDADGGATTPLPAPATAGADEPPATLSAAESCDSNTVTLCILAPSEEEVLHEWLTELLYRHSRDRAWITVHDAAVDRAGTDVRLTARVGIRELRHDEVLLATELKAVTWHRLEVEHDADGVAATVIFDV